MINKYWEYKKVVTCIVLCGICCGLCWVNCSCLVDNLQLFICLLYLVTPFVHKVFV